MRSSKWVGLLGLVLEVFVGASHAQEVTIGEYSQAQRQAIADEMAKLRGVVTPAAPVVPVAPAKLDPVALIPAPPPGPVVTVAGVSIIRGKGIAEMTVDGISYMLEPGDQLPGTRLSVVSITTDRVVVTKPAAGRRGKPETQVFQLRGLR